MLRTDEKGDAHVTEAEGSSENEQPEQNAGRLLAYTFTVSGLGFVLLLWTLTQLPAQLPAFALFVALIILSELTTSEVFTPQISFSMSSAVVFATLLLFGPLPSALVAMFGGFVTTLMANFVYRRQRASLSPFLQRALFNMAAFGLAAAAGGGVYLLAGGSLEKVALVTNVLPMVLAAALTEMLNAALVIVAVSIQTGLRPFGVWKQNVSWAIPIDLLSMGVGGGGLALAYQIAGILGLVVFLLPIGLTIYAFRLYVARSKAQMAKLEETIAELRQAQGEIQRQAAHLEGLNAIIAAASVAPDLPKLLDTALDHTLQALQVGKGAIWVSDQIVLCGIPAAVGSALRERVRTAGADLAEVAVVEDWAQVPDSHLARAVEALMAEANVRASITVPIRAEDGRIGGLAVAASTPRTWAAEEVALVEAVGRQLGAAAERLRLLDEVHRHAEELEIALARLQELDRLKSEFMQNASHELRTPLSLIRGYVELMAEGELGELPPSQHQAVGIISQQTKMLGSLVEDITTSLSVQGRSLLMKPVSVEKLVTEAVESFHLMADRAGLALKADIEPDLPPIRGEVYYLHRVLDNLLSNAIKFTPPGGAITVCAQKQADLMMLRVSDTGIGISRDQQARIFERFYQVDGSSRRQHGGMGLGLALVKEIVEAHGGRVSVESELGQGSTFTVILPGGRAVGTDEPSS